MKTLLTAMTFLSILLANPETQYWKLPTEESIYCATVYNEQLFLLAVPKRDICNLYVVNTKDSWRVTQKYELSKKIKKQQFYYYVAKSQMVYSHGYLYIVFGGSYQTSMFIFDIRDAKDVKFVKEVPLFEKRSWIHYVEMPENMVLNNNKLYIQLTRGISVVDIASGTKILNELDATKFIAANNSFVWFTRKNDFTVYQEEVVKPIELAPYFNIDKEHARYNTVTFLDQSSKYSLFATQKEIKEGSENYLRLVEISAKKDLVSSADPKMYSWKWSQQILQGKMQFPFIALKTKDGISIYSLGKDLNHSPNLITNIPIKDNENFVFNNNSLITCAKKMGVAITTFSD